MNVIITGASKGIGKAIAKKLVSNNINIGFCSRNEKEVWQVAKELFDINKNVKIYHQQANLADKKECEKFINNCILQFGNIDALINNAGKYLPGMVHNEAEGNLENMLQTNLFSAYNCTRVTIPNMIKNKKGHIINICSIAGVQPYANGGAYSISKFAMNGFSKNLREEMKQHNIKVTTVYPGATMSNSWAGSGIEANRIMEANDIAETIYTVLHLAPQTVIEEIIMRPILGDL